MEFTTSQLKKTTMENNKHITYLVAFASITTAFIAIMTYLDNQRHKKLDVELKELDKELKLLQLNGKK